MVRFSDFEKGIIATRIKDGWSAKRIAKENNWPYSTVKRYVSKFKQTGEFGTNLHNSGRKRKTDERTDRRIARSVVGSPSKRRISSVQISTSLKVDGTNISPRTVRRRLSDAGLSGHKAVKKPLLSKKNIAARLKWAQDHLNWNFEDWSRVCWSDEAPFVLFGGKGRQWVRRRANEALHPHCVQSTVKHGGGKIMVWGCFSAAGVGHLTRIQGIMDQNVYKSILVNHARPSLKKLGTNIFQQDNDPKHKANKIMDYLNSRRWPAELLEWPAQSPDLNPIENIWSFLDNKVRARATNPSSKEQFFIALEEEWKNLDADYLINLVKSMPRRCQSVVQAKGYWISY